MHPLILVALVLRCSAELRNTGILHWLIPSPPQIQWHRYRHAVYASSHLWNEAGQLLWIQESPFMVHGSRLTYITITERLRVSTLKADQP